MKLPIKKADIPWFYVEKPNAPAHFGPLIIMTPPKKSGDNFVRDLVNEWRECKEFSPPFNYRLSGDRFPKWYVMADNEIDLEYHFRHSALPAPGGEKELGELVSRLHSHPLDRSKPLWECHIIEGLENGRFAIFIKLHHGQLDGMGMVKLIYRSFSASANSRNMMPPWAIGMLGKDQSERKIPKKKSQVKVVSQRKKRSRFSSLAKSVSVLPNVSLKALGYMANSYGGLKPEMAAPFQAPDTILNGRISGQRRYATQTYSLNRIKDIAKSCNVKMNDVFLAICGGGLRRYLAEHEALPGKPLIGQVPINIRPPGDSSIGNSLSFLYTSLGTDIEDPISRVLAVNKSVESSKSVQEHLPPGG